MELDQRTPQLRNKILNVVIFISLVVVFSAGGIYVRNQYGPTAGFGFTLVFVPVILKLAITKARTIYASRKNSGQ